MIDVKRLRALLDETIEWRNKNGIWPAGPLQDLLTDYRDLLAIAEAAFAWRDNKEAWSLDLAAAIDKARAP